MERLSKLNAGFVPNVLTTYTRNVAYIAEVLSRADRKPTSFSQLSFFVLAPRDQIKSRTFHRHLDKQSINDKVNLRISSYDGDLDEWFKDWFTPTLEVIDIRSISWEAILYTINENDPKTYHSLMEYYSQCLINNG